MSNDLDSKPPTAQQLLFLMQTATGMYPTGAFNHSYGFEALVEDGLIHDRDALAAAGRDWLLYGIAPVDGAITRLAFRRAYSANLEQLGEVDRFTSRIKTNKEERDASLKTGQAFIDVTKRVFSGPAISDLSSRIASGTCHGHQAVAFGAAAADAEIDEAVCVLAFMYSSLSNLASVVARLVPLGQTDVQVALRDWWPDLVAATEATRSRTMDDIASSTGALDIAVLRHEVQSVRLCMS